MLLGQIAEARCTQMVNPKYTFICKVANAISADGAPARRTTSCRAGGRHCDERGFERL